METVNRKKKKAGRPVKQVKKEVRAAVRYSRVEYFVIKEKAAQAGISISNYIREITINGQVMARLTKEEGHFVRQLVGMSGNINQLTKACHQQGLLQAMLYFEHFRDQLDVILKKLTP